MSEDNPRDKTKEKSLNRDSPSETPCTMRVEKEKQAGKQ
jgi:hypothetical protein